MAFPFPQNPVDGQAVSHLAADGTLLKATYNASKNCWDVERAMRQSPLLMTRAGVSIPTATADKQVMTWDATANQWVASTIALSTRDLSDVDKATAPTGQSFLVYDAALNKYKPVPLTGGAVLTATTVGLNAQLGTGTVSQALTALFKLARPASNPKGGDAYIVNAVRASSGLDKYSGTYLFDGTTWVRAANDSSGAAAHYRVTSATAQEPGNRIGDLDILNELNNHQLNAYDGTAYQTVFSEQAIKQWIAAGSLFQGTLKTDSELTALPAAGPSNRGFYWTWTGAPSHVVTSPLAVTLQVGDWIQSDGVKYIHVPSDLMSKQRWASVGSFRTWADTDFEQDTLVAHNFKLYRATSAVVAGDVEPGVAGSKWQEIQVKLTLEELTNVNDNVSVYGQDCVLVWDEADQEWTASRTLEIDAIEFDESGPGTQLTGIAATSLTLTDPTTNPEQWAASVYAVKDAISSLTLEELDNTKQLAFAADGDVVSYNATLGRWEGKAPGIASLADVGDVNIASIPTAGQVLSWDTASSRWVPKAAASSVATLTDVDLTTAQTDGQVLAWNAATSKWKPKSTSSPILFIGSGALKAADIADGTKNNGMPTDTVPPPASYPPAPGDQYLDLMTGVVTAFTGTVVGTPRAGTITGVTSPATKDLIPEALDKLLDVTITSPADKQILQYDNAASQWKNVTPDYLNPTNGYTKTDIDNKLNSVVLGLEHEASVLSRTDIPPASPILGDVHIVGVTPTGVWIGQNNFLARWNGTAWEFSAPRTNESHLIEDVGETWHWNGTNWVKVAVAQAAATSGGELWQVGSIQQSILTETQWASVIGPEATKWVLADGRNVAGSRYATVTGQTNVPDLRGAFIRAAGQNSNKLDNWNGNAVGTFHNDTTRMPRAPFTASASTAGEHKHWQTVAAFTGSSAGTHTWSGGTPTAAGEETWANGNHSHTITVAGGDTETAPVHYSLHTFIKIN